MSEPIAWVWVVVRGFEDLHGIEVDVFDNEPAAREHAARLGWTPGDEAFLIREETVASSAWAPSE